ncbi:oligosaccharide flippase family protein [Vibrio gallicus]|uniref:oligosaccharide flippase family protein n=1 Tax=Vibrio gallicus TaxID=190897 RepID=UPI0021C2B537|nr:oligosaccharide flippase family protein [Vibrio gallicus]
MNIIRLCLNPRIINMGIRVLILLSKFLLMIVLARMLTVYELGVYGLIQGISIYFMYFTGLDLYTYSTREIIKQKSDNSALEKHISSIFILSLVGVAITTFFIIFNSTLSGVYPLIITLILIEYYNQELGRVLIAKQFQLVASVQLFIRSALWCYVVAAVYFFSTIKLDLKQILLIWLIFSFLAVSFSVIYVLLTKVRRNETLHFSFNLDIHWLLKAIKTSLLFFIGTLAIRSIFILDKLYLDKFGNIHDLGIYVFYSSFAGVLLAFCDSAIFQFFYPKLIKLLNESNRIEFGREIKITILQAVIICSAYIIGLMIFMKELLDLIGKEEYLEQSHYFWMLSAFNVLVVFSTLCHYVLYAFEVDKKIMKINILNLALFVLFIVSGQLLDLPAIDVLMLSLLSSTVITFMAKIYTLTKIQVVW